MNSFAYFQPMWWIMYGAGAYMAYMERFMTIAPPPPTVSSEEDD